MPVFQLNPYELLHLLELKEAQVSLNCLRIFPKRNSSDRNALDRPRSVGEVFEGSAGCYSNAFEVAPLAAVLLQVVRVSEVNHFHFADFCKQATFAFEDLFVVLVFLLGQTFVTRQVFHLRPNVSTCEVPLFCLV